MALVFRHNIVSEGEIGKFLGDGVEYLACIRDERFIDFYRFPDFHIKSKTVEWADKDTVDSFEYPNMDVYRISPELDNLAIEYYNSIRGRYKRWYLNSAKVGKQQDADSSIPSSLPGYSIRNKTEVWKGQKLIFSMTRRNSYYVGCDLLSEDTIVTCDQFEGDQFALEAFSLKTNQVISKLAFEMRNMDFAGCIASYISKEDRSKLIVFLGESENFIHVVDISHPEAQDITDRYNVLVDSNNFETKFLGYDEANGFPIFYLYERGKFRKMVAVFNGNGFSTLILDSDANLYNNKYTLTGSNVYEITVSAQGNPKLVFKTSLPALGAVEHTYRDLAGTVYIGVNSVCRNSLTFCPNGVLSKKSIEPVSGMFWVGNGLVLLSGSDKSVVVNMHTAEEVCSWYKPEQTLFANENFQVCESKVYTDSSEIELPFTGATMFASSGSSIVIGCPTRVAIISQDLKVDLVAQNAGIISVFAEGYVNNSGVKFFKTPERNVFGEDIECALLTDDALLTVSLSGELRQGENQEKVDLMIECVNFVRKLGDSVLIYGTNDSYIYSKGEYFSIEAGEYESILVSDDTNFCLTLEDGVVYSRANVGFRMTKKKIGGIWNYESVSVCNDKLMCVQQSDSLLESNFLVKHIAGNVTTRFQKPREWGAYQYILFSQDHFLEYAEELQTATFYSLKNPELEAYKDIFTVTSNDYFWLNTFPSLKSNNKVYVAYRDSCDVEQKVFESKNGKVVTCDWESHQTCPTGHQGEDHREPYKLGLQPAECPRSGDHWMISEWGDRKWKFRFFRKSVKFVPLDPLYTIDSLVAENGPHIRSIQAENDPTVYYVCDGDDVYKASVDGTQEKIASTKGRWVDGRYTTNHGSRIKYEPDFIFSGQHVTTITILRPEEAKKLKAVQEELVGNSDSAHVVSEIDGRFLLSAAMDTKNEFFFTKHEIDVNELKKDLWELFK